MTRKLTLDAMLENTGIAISVCKYADSLPCVPPSQSQVYYRSHYQFSKFQYFKLTGFEENDIAIH